MPVTSGVCKENKLTINVSLHPRSDAAAATRIRVLWPEVVAGLLARIATSRLFEEFIVARASPAVAWLIVAA
jgi:hypothetical protein